MAMKRKADRFMFVAWFYFLMKCWIVERVEEWEGGSLKLKVRQGCMYACVYM